MSEMLKIKKPKNTISSFTKAFLTLTLLPWAAFSSAEEFTPVLFTDMLAQIEKEAATPWIAPDYSGQDKALGYGPGAFAVPLGMEARVNFWIDIYTKHNTDQGVLHDSRYVGVVYESVDFADIMANQDLDLYQKERARRKRVDAAKDTIRERLNKLATLSNSDGLTGEDLKYWNLFANIDEEKKFTEAAKEGRLRFQLGQRNRFMEGIYQSGKFLREMETIFREEGLPIELTRLPFVESSFNLNARSKVGASGIWQFMRRTGKEYMKIDAEVDERNDPILATWAAARKLRGYFKMLESWPLAVTGYNHGPSGVRRLVQKAGTTNISELTDMRKGTFGFASASFYASFIAAIEVEKNAKKYFGSVSMAPALVGHQVRLKRTLDSEKLLSWFNGDLKMAKDFNPHVSSGFWKGFRHLKRGHMIRVPMDKRVQVEKEINTYQATTPALTTGETHKVAVGETLSQIAEKYKVSTPKLMEVNSLSRARDLQAGQVLQIPGN